MSSDSPKLWQTLDILGVEEVIHKYGVNKQDEAVLNAIAAQGVRILTVLTSKEDIFSKKGVRINRMGILDLRLVFSGLENIDVLDIGCGGFNAEAWVPNVAPRTFEPWLPRILSHWGARVTGIDLLNPNRYGAPEDWEHVQADLIEGMLPITSLGQGRYDIVTSNDFIRIDSSQQQLINRRRKTCAIDAVSPTLRMSLDELCLGTEQIWQRQKDLAMQILQAASHASKPDAVLALNSELFDKDESGQWDLKHPQPMMS